MKNTVTAKGISNKFSDRETDTGVFQSAFQPVIFLGVAEHFEAKDDISYNLYQLSWFKAHFIFPAATEHYSYIFLISKDIIENQNELYIQIVDEHNNELAYSNLKKDQEAIDATSLIRNEMKINTYTPKESKYVLINLKFNVLFIQPGNYTIRARWHGEFYEIGALYLEFATSSYSAEQIRAIESNPHACQAVRIELGCKFCSKKLKAYYSTWKRIGTLEYEGFQSQQDLPEDFACDCGKTKFSLKYIKEGLQNLLLNVKNPLNNKPPELLFELNYERNTRINSIIQEFYKLLNTHDDEQTVQRFIEEHSILLAQFAAKKLFNKPKILGKYIADFGILDSNNRLILIELEKPSLKLFKDDGHPTAGLNHAYGQVNDWLYEYSKHPQAVLEGFNLSDTEVSSVKGVVIAGRTSKENKKHLRKHLSKPLNPDIDFLTLENLAENLFEIAKNTI